MIPDKRIYIFSGHYGSGKTNIAVDTAFALRRRYQKVVIADIDIVNPYFRTKDSRQELQEAGIRLISSRFAGTNVDVPALPQDIYAITCDASLRAVIDVGGDDRGALALGRLRDSILAENDYEMLMVFNMYRPLTGTAGDALGIMREITGACKIPWTGIINNSNLGIETTAQDVLDSVAAAETLSGLSGVPLVMTTVSNNIYNELKGKIKDLRPLGIRGGISSNR